MEHPGEASTPFQGCILFGTVNGTIGEWFSLLLTIDLTISSLNQACKRVLKFNHLVFPQISIMKYEIVVDLSNRKIPNY